MNNVVLIGLCGRSGSGKGYVCRKFHSHGFASIDTDAVYAKMTAPAESLSPCMRELRDAFGDQAVLPDNALNRSYISSLVFSENGAEHLQTLNRITHKHILTRTLEEVERFASEGYRYILLDAPLLFESGLDKKCAFTVCVCASDGTAVERIMRRDGICEEDAYRRLAAQIPAEKLISKCDYCIVNERCSDTLEEQVADVVHSIRSRTEIQ